jgi:hypothetical protein
MRLKDIGSEMVQQSNRSTQYPLFIIQVDRKRWVSEYDDHDGAERKEDYDYKRMCDSCRRGEDTQNPELEFCEDCPSDMFNYFVIEDDFELMPGVFFTDRACQAHIDANRYHYRNPRVYGIGAWRNPEMQKVMQHLVKQSGNEVPHFYQ